MAHKIMVNCGHGTMTDGKWDPGCVYGSYTEAGLMLPITKAAVKYLRASGVTVYSDADKGNNRNIVSGVSWANSLGVELFVSIHCDYKGAPSGCMPLYVSTQGKKLATALNTAVKSGMGMKSRGVIKRTDLYELNATNMPACIMETGSIKADLSTLKGKADAYGKCIAKGICSYLGVTFKDGNVVSETTKASTSTTAAKKELYRVRASWTDAKSQAGAFESLENAKALADKLGLNVYNATGGNVYSGKKDEQLYRVRLTWADVTSQKGAFKDLSKARALCNKYIGYHVYDKNGTLIHTSTAKTSAGKLLEACADMEKKCVSNGFVYSNDQSKYTYDEALKTNKRVNCARYVSWAMQTAGLLPSGQVIWLNSKINGNGNDDIKKTCTISYPKKKPANCSLQAGDICGFSSPHTMVYAGKDANGNLLWYSAGSSDVSAKEYGPKRKDSYLNKAVTVRIRPK